MTNMEKIGALAIGALTLFGIGAAAGSDIRKDNRTKAGIEKASREAVDQYINEHPIYIRPDIIENAVRDYTASRIKDEVGRVSSDIRSKAKARLDKEVDDIFRDERDRYAQRVADELDKRVNRTDIRDIVVDDVREKFMDKLDDIVDTTVSDYVEKNGEKIISDRTDAHFRNRRVFF